MKNTILFTMMFMMSFSLVGQSTNPIESYGITPNQFVNSGWFVNTTEITSQNQTYNETNETIYTDNTNTYLDVSFNGFPNGSTTSTIKISKSIPSGYENLNIDIDSYNHNNGGANSIQLEQFINGVLNTTSSVSIGNNNYDINDLTDSIVLVFQVSLDPFMLKGFGFYEFIIYGDLITNIQENITNNFDVYAYNKNLVVKTTEFEAYALTVYNLSGQEVFTKNTNDNQNIPLNLATGMYIVNINNGKESFNQKVVVQ